MLLHLVLELGHLGLCESILSLHLFLKMSGGGGGYAILLVETTDKKLRLYGSLRGDLEDADEITEVNGRCLDRWPREHIADYVRRSILSRSLFLRVKPKRSQEPVKDVKVQDTFLISVSAHSSCTEELFTSVVEDMTQLTSGQTGTNKEVSESKLVAKGEKGVASAEAISPTSLLQKNKENNRNSSDLPPKNDDKIVILKEEVKMALVQPVYHREMAVDCPDTFIAVAKTTPKYPQPKKNVDQETHSLKKSGLYYFSSDNLRNHHERSSSFQDGADNCKRTPPTPRISEIFQDSLDDSGRKSNGSTDKHCSSDNLKGQELQDRIKKYQDEIRKRKVVEELQLNRDEFLRSSLRESQKLRALEKKYLATNDIGVENTAFQLEEGEVVNPVSSEALVGAVLDESTELIMNYESSQLLDKFHNIKAYVENSTTFDLLCLEKLLHNEEFKSVLALHNKIQALCCFRCLPVPVMSEAQELCTEIINEMQDVPSKNAKELIDILNSPSFDHFLFCHDQIAEWQETPDVSEEEELLTRVSQYTEESIKIVRVEKTNEPLGATVKREGEAVVVGRIVKGGVAEKSGLLHEGDEILEVNGMEMRGKSVNDVCDIMARMSGNLTFLIVPNQYTCSKPLTRETVMHLKAHFDYEPDDDFYIPCRELGMSFQKGDVLHIISQEDPNWWQAYREGEEDQMLAGLIPSKSFQQQREKMKQDVVGDVRERKSKKAKLLCARRKKKKLYQSNCADDGDTDQILTYEEVCLYYPRAQHKRPLVLIGPQKIGRHELRQRLMEDTSKFAAAVPHTSRQRKDNEVDGIDYHFINRAQFEADILSGRFVEHGEYQKSYYGTSLDAIRCIINCGKTCVLNLHSQSLKILKKSDLKPYVVFIAPPSFEKLRQNCLKADPAIKDEELKDIIEKAREMEEFYGHYFDLVLINVDLEKTYSELLHAVSITEREPQWVPASWMKDITFE